MHVGMDSAYGEVVALAAQGGQSLPMREVQKFLFWKLLGKFGIVESVRYGPSGTP